MNNKILFIGTHLFEADFKLSSQHLARYFSENGYSVFYISAPISLLHIFVINKLTLKRIRNFINGGRYINENLFSYVPFSFITPNTKPFLNSKFILERWQKYSIPNTVRVVKNHGYGEVDILFMDNIFQPFWLTKIRARKILFRLTDLFTHLPGWNNKFNETYNKIINKADYVLFPSFSLYKNFLNLPTRKKILVPNGIDIETFSVIGKEVPFEIRKIKKPIAIYVGSLDKWIDIDSVNNAAKALPMVSFIIISHDRSKLKTKKQLSENIYFFNTIPHYVLPAVLNYSDIGLIPFRLNLNREFVDVINPIKLHEYLACGLKVVASKTYELQKFSSQISLYSNEIEFIESIKENIDKNSQSDNKPKESFHLSNSFKHLIKRIQ